MFPKLCSPLEISVLTGWILNGIVGKNVKLLQRGISLQSFALGDNYLSILTVLITACVNIPANKPLFNIDQDDGRHQNSLHIDRLWAINLGTSQKSRRTRRINFLSTCYCGSRSCVCSLSDHLERMLWQRSLLCWGAYGHGENIQNVRWYLQSPLYRTWSWMIQRNGRQDFAALLQNIKVADFLPVLGLLCTVSPHLDSQILIHVTEMGGKALCVHTALRLEVAEACWNVGMLTYYSGYRRLRAPFWGWNVEVLIEEHEDELFRSICWKKEAYCCSHLLGIGTKGGLFQLRKKSYNP